MLVTGIRLENVRVFEGEHFIPIDPGLTVLIGRNNAGKSTVLRAPFLLNLRGEQPLPASSFQRADESSMAIAVQISVSPEECLARFGFDVKAIRRIQTSGVGGGRNLAKSPPFVDWEKRPLIEFGLRWNGGDRKATMRFAAGHLSGDYFEFRGDRTAITRIDGATQKTNADLDALAPALSHSLGDDHRSVVGPTLAFWEHHRFAKVTGWINDPRRRICDMDEDRLQQALTFLKMKHYAEFERISDALRDALPEFSRLDFLDSFDADDKALTYRPGFVAVGGSNQPLARESVGGGAWAFLCVLTVARAAKATGARVLFLDEPHLYMHPGLERRLLDELLDKGLWDGEPLQIVAATHSPTFVNAAIEHGTLNVLDWKDGRRKSARAETIRWDDDNARRLGELVSDPGDILYADRIVFVEGPSDIAALRILARERCKLKCSIRYVPLRETDAVAPDIARFFSIVVQAGGAGAHTRAVLLLDGDKRAQLENKWDKAGPDDPRETSGLLVRWSNPRGNDLESVFCDEAFLVAYYASLGVPEETSRPLVKVAITRVAFPAVAKASKGCVAIRSLHAQLLGEADGGLTKADDLEALMRFYVGTIGSVIAKNVEAGMKPIENALLSLDRAQLRTKTS